MNCFLKKLVVGTMARNTTRATVFNHSAHDRRLITTCFFNRAVMSRWMSTKAKTRKDATIDASLSKWTKNDTQPAVEGASKTVEVSLKAQKDAVHPLDMENWIQVYKFRFIVATRTAVRLKLYHTALCFAAIPCLWISHHFGFELDSTTNMFIIGFNMYVLLTTLFIGNIGQKLVGILYINDKKDKVRIARLSFHGHRVDTMHDLNDVMTFSDSGERNNLPFVHLRRYSQPKDQLVMFTSFGITNSELFEEIFGEIPRPPPSRISK